MKNSFFKGAALSRSAMKQIMGGYMGGGASCTKKCASSSGGTKSYGCYSNLAGQSPACLCLFRLQNNQCN